ncbi:MAG TPA: hypothetical protein PLU53_15260 [Bacteroidia bacterium]|nr:hypothetical protein [Bacteroidia bacterium]
MKNSALIFTLLFSSSAFAQWTGAVTDTLTHNSERDEVNHRSLVCDQSNTIHLIAQRAVGSGGWMILYFMHPPNNPWTPEDTVSVGPSQDPELAISSPDGIPVIACAENDTTDSEIIVYTKNGTGWTREQVTHNPEEDSNPSVAIDKDGFIHLAWIWEDSSGNYKISYGNNLHGSWNIQTLVNSQLGPFGSGAGPLIALDPYGIAHIVYRGGNFGTYRIHHAYNDSPGGSNWSYDYPASPNAEDLSSSLVVTEDSVIHLLVSGNDGWGFPVHAYYFSKSPGAASFSNPVAVANGFSAETGCLFIHNNSAACVLNEVSGNIFTGNIIYSDETSGWIAGRLFNTQDIYNAQLTMDPNGNGYLAAYQGNTFQTEEIIVYGPDITTEIMNRPITTELFSSMDKNGQLILEFHQAFRGIVQVADITGKIIWASPLKMNAGEKQFIPSNSFCPGIYFIIADGAGKKSVQKLILSY